MEIEENYYEESSRITKSSRPGSAKRREQPSDRDLSRNQIGSRPGSQTKSPKFDDHLKQLEKPAFGDHLKDIDTAARASAGRDSHNSTHSVHERPPSGAKSTQSHHSRDQLPATADNRPPSHRSHHSQPSRHSHHSHREAGDGDPSSGDESWESESDEAAAGDGTGRQHKHRHSNGGQHRSHSGSRNSRKSKDDRPDDEKPRFVVADGTEWDPSYEQQVTALNRFLGLGVNPDAVWKEPTLEREQEFDVVRDIF